MKPNSMKKKLAVLAFYVNEQGNVTEKYFQNGATCSMASDRLQLMPALMSAKKLGYTVEIFSLHDADVEKLIDVDKYDICLIAKMNANTNNLIQTMISANMAALNLFKKSECRIVTLYCDNLMHHNATFDSDSDKIVSEFYKDIIKLSDFIIFPCKKMKELSHRYIKSQPQEFIINDPWQLREWHCPKALEEDKNCRLIWFGNNKNFPYLLDCLPDIIANSSKNQKFLLTILGSNVAHELAKKWIKNYSTRQKNWRFRLVEWNPKYFAKQLEDEISNSHISLLPSNPNDPRKAGVSHNRLVDSIRGGCITIASPMQSYKELSHLALISDNFGAALDEALTNYQQLGKHIQGHRSSKLNQFSPDNNAKDWDNCWKTILQLD